MKKRNENRKVRNLKLKNGNGSEIRRVEVRTWKCAVRGREGSIGGAKKGFWESEEGGSHGRIRREVSERKRDRDKGRKHGNTLYI